MSSSSCPICFEPFVGKFRATPDVCKHVFCMLCLQTWSKTDNVCPIDRLKFKKIINLDSDSIIQIKPQKRRPKRVLYDVTRYCEACRVSNNGDVLLLCDSCDLGYHSKCLTPPLTRIPSNAWNCPECVAIDRRLRANNSRTKDRTLTIKYAKKRKKESGCISKTKELRIRYNSKKQQGRRGASSKTVRAPEQEQNFDDQPGPSTSTVSREDSWRLDEDEEIDFSNFDFESSSSEDSADEISHAIADFHQQVELGNKEKSEERSPLTYYDEFQDFDVFADNEESMPVSSEPYNSATSACRDESNDSFDIDINFDSSSENSESEVQDSKETSTEKPSKYKFSENGCYYKSLRKTKNETDSVRKSEVSSCSKHNNPSANNFDSLYSKNNFTKSLKETGDLNQIMESSETNCNVIDNAKVSEESLHAQQNIPITNNLNFQSSENVFKKSNNKPGHLNIRNDRNNALSNEGSNVEVDNEKQLSHSLCEKQDHSTTNNLLLSSSENNFMKNLKKARHLKRNNNAMESEEHLLNTPKENIYINREIDRCKNLSSENNHNEINCLMESGTKPCISNINGPEASSSENNFLKNLKNVRELKRKNYIKSHFKVKSPIKKTNEARSQVKSETLDDYEQDAVANSCSSANSTFEDSNSTSVRLENSSSLRLENEIDVFDKHKEKLCLEEDSCNTTSSESSESKAILLKLPLRLSFKRRASKTSDQSASTSTDNISASICTIASVASIQHLDSQTASYSDANLLQNSATFSTYNYFHHQNSTNIGEQIDSDLPLPSTSVPIAFSLIEEQNDFKPLPIRNPDCFYSSDSINPWSNFYPWQATSPETSPTKKFKKTDYTLNMEKSGNLIIPSNASHLFGKHIFVKDMKQLSVKKDGALFLNWKHSNS